MPESNILDLDAAKRERASDDIVVRWNGADLLVPGELPADVFDPFLSEDFDLVGIVKAVLDASNGDDDADWLDGLVAVIETNPHFASQAYQAIKDVYALLLGADNFAAFVAGKPSFPDYIALTRGLIAKYGVGLGEAFASAGSSTTGGQTSSPTSPTHTPDSTPETSGDAPEPTPAS